MEKKIENNVTKKIQSTLIKWYSSICYNVTYLYIVGVLTLDVNEMNMFYTGKVILLIPTVSFMIIYSKYTQLLEPIYNSGSDRFSSPIECS